MIFYCTYSPALFLGRYLRRQIGQFSDHKGTLDCAICSCMGKPYRLVQGERIQNYICEFDEDEKVGIISCIVAELTGGANKGKPAPAAAPVAETV